MTLIQQKIEERIERSRKARQAIGRELGYLIDADLKIVTKCMESILELRTTNHKHENKLESEEQYIPFKLDPQQWKFGKI